jgi:hypothetical protein
LGGIAPVLTDLMQQLAGTTAPDGAPAGLLMPMSANVQSLTLPVLGAGAAMLPAYGGWFGAQPPGRNILGTAYYPFDFLNLSAGKPTGT